MRNNTLTLLKSILGTLLCIGAALIGGGAYAMADIAVTTDPDPVGTDSKGLETQLPNGATATHVVETGFNEEEIDRAIAKFRPFAFPLNYDIETNARQQKVATMEPIHYRSGVNPLEDTLLVEKTTDAAMEITISKTELESTSVDNLPTGAVIIAPGVDGENGQPVALYVKACDRSAGTALAYVYNCSEAVTLPEGTKFLTAAFACSESQMIVAPDNYQPVPVTVYLQKKNCSIVFTDEWMEIAKKANFVVADLQDNALYNYKRKTARTHWLGSPAKIKTIAPDNMGDEYVYMEQGIIPQLTMFYSFSTSGLSQADLTAISKMQFTLYAANTDARCYCGKDFIEKLLNMAEANHTYREFFFENVEDAGIKIRRWTNNFGTLDFVYDPTLDDIGYQDFCVVVDIKNATHYVKRAQKLFKQDMKQGTGEIREAQRYIYSTIDCIALKGYNSILVGPADKIGVAQALTNINTFSTAIASLDDAAQEKGLVYYLTEDNADYGFAAKTLVTWDGEWVEYKGEIKS